MTASNHIWNTPFSPGEMNCGEKAMKKTMPFGLSAVTKYVLANNFKRDESDAGSTMSVGDKPARNNWMPR